MTELETYAEIAKRPANANDPGGLADYMLEVSGAISRMSELTVCAEVAWLRKQAECRKNLIEAEPTASEARIAASVESLSIGERIDFRTAESLLRALNQRFKAVQSALSFRKSERQI
jgi:hypothetical protein